MRHQAPLTLGSTLSLYPADRSGYGIAGPAIWLGACFPEALRLRQAFATVDVTPSGDEFIRVRPIPTRHEIEISHLWLIRSTDLSDFQWDAHGAYILEIIWEDPDTRAWYKRTYYDVRMLGGSIDPEGIMQSYRTTQLSAANFAMTAGRGDYGSTVVSGELEQVFFSHLSELYFGSYFLGHYAWSKAREAASAKAVGIGSVDAPTTLNLEINGSASGYSIVLPSVGVPGEEVSATVDLTGLWLRPNDTVRWRVTSAPADEVDQATHVAVVMTIITDPTDYVPPIIGLSTMTDESGATMTDEFGNPMEG